MSDALALEPREPIEPIHPVACPPPRAKARKSWGARLAALVKLPQLWKVIKLAKVLKPLMSFGSMFMSIFVYSFAMGWMFSVGFVLMLFCHETGHALALRHRGMKASLPVFIPFLGAAIFAPKLGNRQEEAYMAFAGPFIGSFCAVVLFGTAMAVPGTHPLLLAIANTALVINLFNLIPLTPLDGGRVTQAIGPAFKYFGVAVLLALTVLMQTPGLLIIWLLIISEMRRVNGTVRISLGVLVELCAAIMMAASIGKAQPFWENVLDLGLMTLLNLVIVASVKVGRNAREEADSRPMLAGKMRLYWLGAYGALAAVLGVMTYISAAQLHPLVG